MWIGPVIPLALALTAEGPPTPIEMASLLDRASALRTVDFETDLRIVERTPGSGAGNEPLSVQVHRYVCVGSRLFCERVDVTRDGRQLYEEQRYWNGATQLTRIVEAAGFSIVLDDAPRAPDPDQLGFLFNLIEGRFPSLPTTVADRVRRGRGLRAEMTEGTIEYVFAWEGVPAEKLQQTVAVQRGDPPRLLRSEIAMSDAEDLDRFEEQVYSRSTVTFSDWRAFGTAAVPYRMDRHVRWRWDPATRTGGPVEQSTTVERTSLSEDPSAELLSPPPLVAVPHGTACFQVPLGLAFRTGDRLFTLAGVPYEAAQPITTLPDDLSKLFEHVRPVDVGATKPPVDFAQSAGSDADESTRSASPLRMFTVFSPVSLLFGLCGAAIVAILLVRAGPRRSREIFRTVGILMVIAVGFWSFRALEQERARNRPALSGDLLHHDFGEIPLTGGEAPLTHRFVLTNSTSSPISIEQLSSSCGCTRLEADTRSLAPGEDVAVTATMEVHTAGRKVVEIAIATDGGNPPTKLSLIASGIVTTELRADRYLATIASERARTIDVVALDRQRRDDLAEPTITTPDALEASMANWRRIDAGDAPTARPALWHGRLSLQVRGGATHDDRGVVELAVPGASPVTVHTLPPP